MNKLLKTALALIGLALAGIWLFGERGRLIAPSTLKFFKERGRWNIFNPDFWHPYVYGRWTNQYIGLAARLFFPLVKPVEGRRYWADGYHGKILTPELAQALVSLDHVIPLQDLEQIVPYATARNIVLQGPPEIVVYECACRHARPNPCQPTQVCMVVGQPFVDFILEHNPQSSRRLTQSEALELLRAEHARGHLHAAYFKDVMLNRFYAICNCCKCCCGGIESMVKHGVPMLTSSGYVAKVDVEKCQACGTCQGACPFGAIQINGTARIDWDKCMGCGVCASQCPHGLISLVRDERKGIPLDVRLLPTEHERSAAR
jgi:ferredoxin